MDKIDHKHTSIAAFAWGVNGFFSVLGTVLVMILAMVVGYRMVFIISALIYLGAYWIIRSRTKELSPELTDPKDIISPAMNA